jgi:ketosteroid isomerase-like protein
MSDSGANPVDATKGEDKNALIAIVKEMTESFTGAQSTRHWAEDALWFDIPPFASRGVQPALKFFDKVFGSLQGGHSRDGRRRERRHGPSLHDSKN